MSYPNTRYCTIEIDGVDYSEHLAPPFTIQETGTEQLGTAIVNLMYLRTGAKFSPFTPVTMGGGKYSYVVANDAVKEVFGRKRWNHELTLIDATKATERVLMEAKAFTQPITTDYEKNSGDPYVIYYKDKGTNKEDAINTNMYEAAEIAAGAYKTPIETPNGSMSIASIYDAFNASGERGQDGKILKNITVRVFYSTVLISFPHDVLFKETPVWTSELLAYNEGTSIPSGTLTKTGIYTIIYEKYFNALDVGLDYTQNKREIWAVPISVINKAEIKPPYTLYDVLEILLQTAEPLRRGIDAPRYSLALTSDQEARFKAMQAPELHFSNGRSLYENLSVIGKIVHAIPRVSASGAVSFKELGSVQMADLSMGQCVGRSANFNAADYASALEANFANLINTEDETEGSVTDPYADGFITLRSDAARITEGASYIPTQFPIARIKQVLMKTHDNDGDATGTYDITKYVFEKSEYEMLSAYSGIYPYSKTFAISYTTGSKNISDLWYMADDAAVDWFKIYRKYAIANIYEEVTGKKVGENSNIDYSTLSFQVTYIPIINGRARQERTENVENGRLVLAHNQSANKLSARAFGENMRGQIAMMANAQQSISIYSSTCTMSHTPVCSMMRTATSQRLLQECSQPTACVRSIFRTTSTRLGLMPS